MYTVFINTPIWLNILPFVRPYKHIWNNHYLVAILEAHSHCFTGEKIGIHFVLSWIFLGFSFQAASSLYSAMQQPNLQCSQCPRTFRSAQGLKVHEAQHAGVFPYHCPYCQLGLYTTLQLRRHLAKHTGSSCEKGYLCAWCLLELGDIKSLKQHIEECDKKPK